MMAGALILLAGSLVPAIMGEENAPAWVSNATVILGYGLLAWGFFKALRARSEGSLVPKKAEQLELEKEAEES